ncbi:NAD(P)H-dependent oxidoreductase [bacterium]|nr:NAD(P)H-dependent oxidoreductase [bacterium]
MNRFIAFIFVSILALAAVACAQTKPNAASDANAGKETAAVDKAPSEASGSKILVAYFSATGVTEKAAQQIADATGGTLYKIQPETPYSDADLDWHNEQSRSSVEMADKASRPAIAGKPEKLEEYSVVYLGFPIWWYTAPTIINTFIEANSLNGKTVIPFATSGGSTIDKACADLKTAYPEINWKEGRLLNRVTEQELKDWTASQH